MFRQRGLRQSGREPSLLEATVQRQPHFDQCGLFRGQLQKAGRVSNRPTSTLQPLPLPVMYNIGSQFAQEGNTDSALVWLKHSLQAAPDLVLSHVELARIYGTLGDSARCLAALERLAVVSTRTAGVPIDELRRAWGKGGYKAVLKAQLAASEHRDIPHERARWFTTIGDVDAAFRSLDEAIQRRDIWSPFLEVFPEFAPLRGDPRWKAMRVRVGLPA